MAKLKKRIASPEEISNDPSLQFNAYLRWEAVWSDLHQGMVRFIGYADDGHIRVGTINGILWRLRTGAPWRDGPERYGKWNSIWRCFRRWCQNGTWEAVATTLAEAISDRFRARARALGHRRFVVLVATARRVHHEAI